MRNVEPRADDKIAVLSKRSSHVNVQRERVRYQFSAAYIAFLIPPWGEGEGGEVGALPTF